MGKSQSKKIRQFIIENIEEHPKDIVNLSSSHFNISRQAINKHIQSLIDENIVSANGNKKGRLYSLPPIKRFKKKYQLLGKEINEDVVWRNDISILFRDLPENVTDMWSYCFTEMFNNAIEHSSAKSILIDVIKTAASVKIKICDDGEGIFKKIKKELGLLDETNAILELSKGKLTTYPTKHTGEGIFFTSRITDDFTIFSEGLSFSHHHSKEFDLIATDERHQTGTLVFMKIANNTSKTIKEVFDKFTSKQGYEFNKTVVPVRLAQYENEMLVSRSQARRLLSHIDKFQTVVLDFDGVTKIGQGFADEIFRVFAQEHKERVQLLHINACKDVEQMIMHTFFNIK